MGKAKTADKADRQGKILEGIRKALDGNPHQLQGTPRNPGLFPGGKAGAALAQEALAEGLLREVPTPDAPAKGKRRSKPSVYVSITDRGRQAVHDGGSPVQILSALRLTLQNQETLLTANLDANQTQLSALRDTIEQLQKDFHTQIGHYRQTAQSLQEALQQLFKAGTDSASPAPSYSPGAWLDEAVKFIAEQKRHNAFERLTLPRLYEQLQKIQPHLTLCQYHEGLRRLQEQRRIRLTAYTQALASLPDAQNALYLDREVKYYVDLP